jgi:hypothetical protein
LSLIENNLIIVEKQKQLGIETVADKLALPLNYYDLLTVEDNEVLTYEI